MRIGIDFDNTIVCYDNVFYRAALAQELIPVDLSRDKNSVRDFLNGSGRKDEFTTLQGHVYGTRMDLAALYPGVMDFIVDAVAKGHEIFIVSHKTRYPLMGPRHDLHEAARNFLKSNLRAHDLSESSVFFEETKDAKVARAAALKVDAFIDDLPEILSMTGWLPSIRRILFDPENQFADQTLWERHCTWQEINHALLGA